MRKLGSYMVFFGLFAIVLDFINMVPVILAWIYEWGEGVAWAIKIGLVVVGGALYLMGGSAEEAAEETPAE